MKRIEAEARRRNAAGEEQNQQNENEARKAKARRIKGVVQVLKREYPKIWPKFSKEERDRYVGEALDGAKWYCDIVKKHRLSKDLQTDTGPKIIGGVDDPKTEDATGYGEWVGTGYDAKTGGLKTYDELDAEEKRLLDLARHIRTAEWAFKVAKMGRTESVRDLHISVGLPVIKGHLDQLQISEIAEYHGVTVQRVKQVANEVKSPEIFDH
jgi:hypothetical protein